MEREPPSAPSAAAAVARQTDSTPVHRGTGPAAAYVAAYRDAATPVPPRQTDSTPVHRVSLFSQPDQTPVATINLFGEPLRTAKDAD